MIAATFFQAISAPSADTADTDYIQGRCWREKPCHVSTGSLGDMVQQIDGPGARRLAGRRNHRPRHRSTRPCANTPCGARLVQESLSQTSKSNGLHSFSDFSFGRYSEYSPQCARWSTVRTDGRARARDLDFPAPRGTALKNKVQT